jgi:hypothetical protein
VSSPRRDGVVTRGTTAPNRLRRVDRSVTGTLTGVLRAASNPLVVDLGFGGHPVTTVELAHRLRALRPDVHVVGVEIDAGRVAAAGPFAGPGLSFVRGGFELPVAGQPVLVRAFNVLRQYDEQAAARAWDTMRARLAADGVLVEGTCDELGRRASWVTLDRSGPRTLTLAAQLATLGRPSDLAERLPKCLIHRNVPGEPVHHLLQGLDRAWAAAAPFGAFGARQRWVASIQALRRDGWPVVGRAGRWRQGELTVAWSAVGAV